MFSYIYSDQEFPFCDLLDEEIDGLFNGCLLEFDIYKNIFFNPFEDVDEHDRDFNPDNSLNFADRFSVNKCQYYDVIDYRKRVTPKDVLNFLFSNIRSIPRNLDEFVMDLCVEQVLPDFLGFCETRLSPDIDDVFKIPKYNMFCNSRNTRGGGIALFVGCDIPVERLSSSCFVEKEIECLFVRATITKQNYVVGTIYRPPDGDIQPFLEKMSSILTAIRTNYPNDKIVLQGDFNINLLSKRVTGGILDYISLMFSSDLFPVILRHTRVGPSFASLIDHMWTSSQSPPSEFGIVLSNISDHFTIFCSLSNKQDIFACRFKHITRRMTDIGCLEEFAADVRNFENPIMSMPCPEACNDYFLE